MIDLAVSEKQKKSFFITDVFQHENVYNHKGLLKPEVFRDKRLSIALKLIPEYQYNISEIAFLAGYKDPKYFRYCFKKVLGVTPVDYRKSILKTCSTNIVIDHSSFVKHAFITIENKLSEHFNHNLLAFELNVSRPTLYRKIKALTGLSIIEFVFYVRMNKALKLLETENYSISDVAYLVGYTDQKYFSRCFKAKFGLSPSKYRELAHFYRAL